MLVIAAFFVLAIQLFVTILEFKLSTLAGFVLVPFGLWGKSAFLAERVLGNVATTGVKVLILAVVIGIGFTLFGQFTAALPPGQQPTVEDALGIVLASLVLLGLSLFAGRIAAGVASGAPHLSAGEAAGTAAAGAGIAALGGLAVVGGGRAALVGLRAAATATGAAGAAYAAGAAEGGGVAGGLASVARAGAGAFTGRAATSSSGPVAGPSPAPSAGPEAPAAPEVPAGDAATASGSTAAPPGWAQRLRAHQVSAAAEAVVRPVLHSGQPGAGAAPALDPEGKPEP